MKLVFTILISAVVLTASDPQSKKEKAAPPAPVASKRSEVPQGAVEREPGRFYYTDSAGKRWIYVQTPFGASRIEDTGAGASAPVKKADPFANVKITESGDMVSFERQIPFGTSRWQKKKADLTDEEKAALRRSQQESASKVGEGSTKQDR